MSLSTTGAKQDRRFIKWNGFYIEIYDADPYHAGSVNLEVLADYYEKGEDVEPVFHEYLDKAQEGDPEAMYAFELDL